MWQGSSDMHDLCLDWTIGQTCFVSTGEWCQWGSSHACSFCFECFCRNFATEVSGLSLKQHHINSVVFWTETACVGHSGKWKEGHLSSWGSWEIGGHTSIFNMWAIFFLSHRDNVTPSSTVFRTLHFSYLNGKTSCRGCLTHTKAREMLIRQLLFWSGRNASQLFRA